MQYYTERHGMRIARTKTYDISIDAYSLLFDCCDEYLISLGWRYPEECKDGCGCSGVDFQRLQLDLRYEIPTLNPYDIIMFLMARHVMSTTNMHYWTISSLFRAIVRIIM